MTSLGLRLDNTAVRIAMDLHLGLQLCRPHTCQHCGTEVTEFATHGLSCRKSAGRHFHHAALNDIIHRALSAAHIPSCLEPSGLARADGKRPDGITLAPRKCGQLLVWDATCPDTHAPSYATIAVAEAGAVANQVECKKQLKYAHLGPGHIFTPIAIESSGVFGTETVKFLTDLGHCLKLASGENSAYPFLLQRLSVAVQRGNAASVMGSEQAEDFFCVTYVFVISYVIV